ncbi:hypothetical protein BS78_07G110900 [Paspalum vaginatum]|nr:hypothetical protein BS78_07G110900 [Paspalum vaginatum]KAJ1268103.1 hypothetical protein BS78_07G110900 [Paspalum vaginatum]
MEAPGSISPTRQIEQWRYSLTGSKDGGAPTPDGAAVSVIYSTPTVASSFGTSMTQPAAHKLHISMARALVARGCFADGCFSCSKAPL